MTTVTLAERTQPQPAHIEDRRRVTERDADFVRLRNVTRQRLLASLRRYVRELRAGAGSPAEQSVAQSRFIQRQTLLLAAAYLAAHANGARDYWQTVSLRRAPQQALQVDPVKQRRRLHFYAGLSVAKMAHEAQVVWRQEQSRQIRTLAEKQEQHTGVMVAFFLKPAAARLLALPDGEAASALHITLAFLGELSQLSAQQQQALIRTVRESAATAPPLSGSVSGVGRFNPSPHSEGKVPIIALLNIQGLQKWRAALVERLVAAGLPVAVDFEYTPHITLAYVAEDAPMPVQRVPDVQLTLDQVVIALGDTHVVCGCGAETQTLADPTSADSLDEWLDGLDPRVQLQADLTWTGMQDGYYDGSMYDAANPWYWVEWQLEPLAQHCDDCLSYAAGSPYGPPGSGDNELDASPGDGSTACGAACKCSLGYAPNDTAVVYGTGTLPPDAPVSPEQLTVPAPAPNEDLSDGQKAALDAARDAFEQWDAVRGELPELPDLFGVGEEQGEETPFLGPLIASWDQLTPAQQRAVERLIEAIQMWKDATAATDIGAGEAEGGGSDGG